MFHFSNVEKREFFEKLFKACQDTVTDVSKLLKRIPTLYDFFHPSINASINSGGFSSFLQLATVIPVFKKDSKNPKDNCKAIRILKAISKVY